MDRKQPLGIELVKKGVISEFEIQKALEYQKIVESVLSKTPEEFDDSDIGRMFSFFEEITAMDVDRLLIEYVLPKAIAKRKILGFKK